MSTFRQLGAHEVLFSDRDHRTSPGGIRGLKVAELERVFPAPRTTRTASGKMRMDHAPWDAHNKLDVFKELAGVENITESGDKYLRLEITFTDGSYTFMDGRDILIVEDPIV